MRHILIILLTLLTFQASAQYYTSGSDPARLHWRQIKTPTVRLVFEKSFEKEALRLAAFMDSIAPVVSGTLNHKPGRINMLVHNQTSYSNGFVSWAPKRVELFSTPNQNINSVDWLEHLATHEYRHVVQIDKLNQGFTRITTMIIGQQATGAVLGLYLPMWFMEGDAVATETSLTQSGRGRSYEFNQELKSQLVERGPYSYDKAYMGSFRNQVPDYYKMGYPLVAMARSQYGTEVWENAVNNTGRSIWIPNPFRRSLKRQIGMGNKDLYNYIFKQLSQKWATEVEQTKTTSFNSIVHFNSDYTNFKHPIAINDSTLVCELEGPDIPSQIIDISIPNGQIKTISYTGIRDDEPISANQKFVVWSELKYHARWENESFSIIRTYNRQTGKTKSLTRKTRFFSPAIHPSKPLIAVVQATTDYKFNLVMLDAVTGQILQSIPSPNNQYILTPSWNLNGSNIVAVLQGPKGKSIYSFDPSSGNWAILKAPSYNEVRHPVQDGDDVWYSAKGQVSEEIFHLTLSDKTDTRITSSRYGAANPTILPQSKKLIYSHYTDNGYRPVLYIANQTLPDSVIHQPSVIDQLAHKLTTQEPSSIIQTTGSGNYEIKKYSKLNLIGLHSWAPVFTDINDEKLHTGISVMSQNLLGTSIITAGYNADPAFSYEKYHINLSYRGFFPILDLDMNFGDSQFVENGFFSNKTDTFKINTNQNLNHFYLKAGMRLPFDLSSGQHIRYLEPGFKLTLQQRTGFSYTKEFYTLQNNSLVPTGKTEEVSVNSIDFKGMEYNLLFYNFRRGALRDVSYRMGQLIQMVYRHTPFGTYEAGSIFGVHTKLYLPGVAKHHSIGIDNDWQSKKDGDEYYKSEDYINYYQQGNLFSYPRGYSGIYFDDLYIFRSTYMMPLCNPDFAIAGLAYIKRLRLNLFYDAAIVNYQLTRTDDGTRDAFSYQPSSTGLELHADTHFFRFILPFSIGYRVGYRNMDNSFFHNVIVSTSFGGYLVNKR